MVARFRTLLAAVWRLCRGRSLAWRGASVGIACALCCWLLNGASWVGEYGDPAIPDTGALLRVHHDGSMTPVVEGLDRRHEAADPPGRALRGECREGEGADGPAEGRRDRARRLREDVPALPAAADKGEQLASKGEHVASKVVSTVDKAMPWHW